MGRIIGIDLGTTNSLVSVWENGKSVLIPNSSQKYLTPSVVNIDKDGTVYVGEVAKERSVTDPTNTVSVFKRFMGVDKTYRIRGKNYTPIELSSFILRKLKQDAEYYLQEPVEEAVISVPAYFNNASRSATKRAGELAGLKVERIINEPSAAALAYQHVNNLEDGTLLVFDFGGGTLDVSLVDCFDNIVEILAVSGDNHLGGSDFDHLLYDHFLSEHDLDENKLSEETKAILLSRATKCKIALSKDDTASMSMTIGKCDYTTQMDRKNFIRLSESLLARALQPIKKVLMDGEMAVENLSGVVLVGGSCKMPIIKDFLEYTLGMTEISVVEPDYIIALGIGVYAGIKERREDVKDMMLTDICPFSLGTSVYSPLDNTHGNMFFIIERNSPLPISREERLCAHELGQKRITVTVYQGESHDVSENWKMGEVEIRIPVNWKKRESVTVRYTYDINGILYVVVRCDSTGEEEQLVIQNGSEKLSDKEVKEHLEKLKALMIHPRDKDVNKILLERGNRLFAEAPTYLRDAMSQKIKYFQECLCRQDEYQLQKVRKYYEDFLNYIEESIDVMSGSVMDTEDFYEWYKEHAEGEKEQEEFEKEERQFQMWNQYTS